MKFNGLFVWTSVVMLTACSGGGSDTPPETATGDRSVATRTVPIATGDADCPNGGVLVDTGIDENGNGVLDGDEVDASEKVCHGRDGTNGVDGSNGVDGVGADGSDGLSSQLAFSDEVAGANCPYGGLRIDSGLDSNDNNTLDSAEITQTQFVCSFLSGDFGWQTAELIETDNADDASFPQIAVDASGNVVAVWSQSDGARDSIWSNRYVAGSGWGTAQLIETDDAGNASFPKIAVDASGNAVAVWHQSDGMRNNIWSNRYVTDSGWSTAQLIETDNAGGASIPQIVVDASGNAVAVWYQSDGMRDNILSNRYVAGSGWGTAQLIETDDAGDASFPQIAVDALGNAVAVWDQWDGMRSNIWSNRYVAGSGWGTAQLIETDEGSASAPKIAVDAPGNAVVVWHQSDGPQHSILSNRYVAGSGWGTAELIEADEGRAYSPKIAVDALGNAVAVWHQWDGMRYNTWSNRYVTGSGWGAAALIESNDIGTVDSPQIAMDASGNGLAVWPQENGSREDIWSNRYVVDSGWGTPQLVETDNAGNALYPRIAVDGSGNGIVVWKQFDGTRDNIHANRWAAP